MDINLMSAPDLYTAWCKINEFLYLEAYKIEAAKGGAYSTEWVSYNNIVKVEKAEVDPEFDFGKKLGYNYKKWSSLVGNYVDMRYLEMVRADIQTRSSKKAQSYNLSFHFSNLKGGGKDCLICLVFTKRIRDPKPIVNFVIRTSEVTKRLLFDFLLVQRIIEYVYGHNEVEVHLVAPSFYITAESFIMYNNVKDVYELIDDHYKDKKQPLHKFQEKILATFDKFHGHPDPHSVIFRVNKRSMLQIQKGPDGDPLSGVKSLLAKDLPLIKATVEYPDHIISPSQRKEYLKTL